MILGPWILCVSLRKTGLTRVAGVLLRYRPFLFSKFSALAALTLLPASMTVLGHVRSLNSSLECQGGDPCIEEKEEEEEEEEDKNAKIEVDTGDRDRTGVCDICIDPPP